MVVWTPEAQQDRADVWDYIAADNPRAAARMDELFSDAAALLGRPRRDGGEVCRKQPLKRPGCMLST
jgi:plasmid stabilization system protein ParE